MMYHVQVTLIGAVIFTGLGAALYAAGWMFATETGTLIVLALILLVWCYMIGDAVVKNYRQRKEKK